MSDEEDQSSTEADFSASEDEWKPGKNHRPATDEESDDDDSDFENDAQSSKRREAKFHPSSSSKSDSAAKQTKKRKSTATSLRTKLFNKYKPPPKTLRNLSTPSKAVMENRISATSSQLANKHVRVAEKSNSSDSDSSGDDYLVNPNEINLQSSFFNVKPSTSGVAVASAGPPQFDCNAGMQLSDTDEDIGDDDDDDYETESFKQPTNAIAAPVDLGYLNDFVVNMEKEKTLYKQHKERSQLEVDTKEDVSSLLAMNENMSNATTSTALAKKTKNPKHQSKKSEPSHAAADTDSDWEEVEANDHYTNQVSDALTNGIQVTIELPQGRRKDKKAIDMEATVKRRLNRIIKENQVYLHKVSLLCHIYHGLFLNKVANNIDLMPLALKLLPSKMAYPSGETEIKYFQSMATWYKAAVKIHDDRMYPRLKVNPVLSLAVQIKHRHAVCRRDFILMFVILLRAMGMQCRLVVNLVPMPLKPAQSALCSLKMKTADRDDTKKKVVKEEKISAKKGPLKSPTLSMKEREELKLKVQTLEKEILKKKTESLKPKLSFEEELESKVPSKPEKNVKVLPKPEKKKDQLESKAAATKIGNRSEIKILPKTAKKNENLQTSTTVPKVNEQSEVQMHTRTSKRVAKLQPKATSKNQKFEKQLKSNGLTETDKEKLQLTKDDLKRKSLDYSNEPDKKRKPQTTATKSTYFPDSSQKHEQNRLIASLDSHSKSFEEQQPSISINSKAAKVPPARCVRTRKDMKPNPKEKTTPDIVIEADNKLNMENITHKQKAPTSGRQTRSGSKSPKLYISAAFLKTKPAETLDKPTQVKRGRSKSPIPSASASCTSYISTEFLKSKTNSNATVTKDKTYKPSPRKLRSKTKLTVPQLDGADNLPKSRRKQTLKKPDSHNSDDDFHPSVPKKLKALEKVKKLDRQVLSPDTGDETQASSSTRKNAINMWVEVYSELEAQWVCVDLFKGKVNCADSIRKTVTPSTLAYVFAFNNDATIKDVTPRYCAQWAAVVRKSRVEQSWVDSAIRQHVKISRTQRDLTEDMDLRRIHLDKPMPTSISEYKDHPLYALERHLLKFQAIYPPNALTLGFVRSLPVYARECVHTLHSREIWLKSARVVKPGEKPYKIVKARPKWDKFTSTVIKNQPLEIFGYWQTQDYEPPTAENGIVPRNAYGNVELFKECMLPKKTVHLHLPGLNKVCKKLGIDCVPAVIGFDFHQGSCHPLYDGFVVCEEFAEKAADAWDKEQQNAERKEQEKYEARVYGNWKKLIKGLLIRERLKIKYNF